MITVNKIGYEEIKHKWNGYNQIGWKRLLKMWYTEFEENIILRVWKFNQVTPTHTHTQPDFMHKVDDDIIN